MFATNFTALDDHVRFTRGEGNLTVFAQKTTTFRKADGQFILQDLWNTHV
jgi:hypothetical protein